MLERFPSAIDVLGVATCEPTNRGSVHTFGNFGHRFEVTWRSDRESRFDDINTQIDQGMSNLQLLV